MTTMTREQANQEMLAWVTESGDLPNIGQFSHDQELALARLVRSGAITKRITMWPYGWDIGLCRKTFYSPVPAWMQPYILPMGPHMHMGNPPA